MGFDHDTIVRDVRYATRTLVKQAGFSVTAIGLLAVGISGTTAIFSVFNGLFLRPLPFSSPERLVNLDETAPKWNLKRTGIAYPDFHAWRAGSRAFDGMSVFRGGLVYLSDDNSSESAQGANVTHDLAGVLKVRPALGRWFLPEEDQPGGRKVVVISHGLWQRRFAGGSDVLGKSLRVNAQLYTIIGVMPPEVDFPNRAELWTTLQMSQSDSSGWNLQGVARLRDGVTINQGLDDLNRVHKGMIPAREVNNITSAVIFPLRDWYVGNFRDANTVLLAAVGLVLLMVCTNIAGLMLARGSSRTREIGIRAALGASRQRIIRQLLTESLLIGIVGTALGIALGVVALKGLLALMPANQIPGWVRFDFDWRFLVFCLVTSGGSALLFGLSPAWNASSADVRESLTESTTRSTASSGRRRSLNALIIGEIALATVLLTSASLLVQAFRKVQQVDPGFQAENVLTYDVNLPGSKYPKPEQRLAFVESLIARQSQLPGVRIAAAASSTPFRRTLGQFL